MVQQQNKYSQQAYSQTGIKIKDYPFIALQVTEQSWSDSKALALEAYEQAIKLAPCEASLHYRKARVLEQLGSLAEADETYAKARLLEQRR